MPGFTFTTFAGPVYRATSHDTPVWVIANRRPGRWNLPEDGTIAQYFSIDSVAPWAEIVRHEDLPDAESAAELRMDIWELRLSEGAMLDLSSPSRAERFDLEWESLVSDDWTYCQEVGRQVLEAGGKGIVSPSAALPGSLSLTVFGARSEIAWDATPRLSIQVPARHVMTGHPGEGVVRGARRFGDPYPRDVDLPSIRHLRGG